MGSIDEVILKTENTEEFIRNLMSSLVNGIRSSNSIPTGGDYDYYSTFPKFSTDSKKLTEDTTKLIFEISRMIEPSKQNELSPDLMESSLYEHVVDMIDMLLERASLNLDDEAGIAPSVSSIRDSLSFDRKRIFQETNSTIEKPQSKFPGDVDNSRIRPFCPKLKLNSKPNRHPHAPRELTEHALDVSSEEQLSYLGPKTYFPHPYEMEIKEFSKNIPSLRSYFDEIPNLNPPMPPGLADYPMQYIETPEQLSEMIREIEHETSIAIDLEHHDYRTYQGLTCLMQISSRSKDYIIDTLSLREEMSNLLPIFTSPDIVKVFHGCDHDILWLQRDFGLYVVNCFDTYHAAKLLRYPALSLAHLLKYYCGVILNKKYQLADWRLRKLTDEMIHYAQSDTHYLLYIYDNIRKDIFHHQGINGVIAVLQSSQRTCLKRYEKEYFYPHGYLHLLNQRTSQSLTLEQNLILSLLWNWRDLIARKEDESVSYIMSNSELIRIGLRCPKSELEFHECGPFSEFLSSTKGMISHLVHFIGQELGIKPSASSSNVLEANISDLDMRHRAGSSNASIEEVFLEDPNQMNSNSLRAITPDHFSKPIHVLSAQDGRFGQVHRLQGCNTIKEIHPSIGNRDLAMASPGADLFLASTTPISHFDDEKQQFELHSEAEWKQLFMDAHWNGGAPSPQRPHSSLGCFSPDFEAVFAASGVNPDQIPPQLKLPNLSFPKFASAPLVSADSVPDTEAKMEEALAGGQGKITPDELPQSLKEIYNISNKNRWKNKDKKRNRELENAADSTVETAEDCQRTGAGATTSATAGAGSGNDLNEGIEWIDAQNPTVEKTPEGSVDFAIQIGWIDSESKSSMLEKHLADEHANNTAQLQSPSGEDHTRPGSANSDPEHSSNKKGNKSSSSNGVSSKPHLKPRSNSGDRKLSASYDYSKISNSSAVSAMSGLTNNQHQSITSRPLSSSAPSASGHDRRQRNPFVSHQGGNHSSVGGHGGGSRGNSRERVNSKGGGGGGGNQGNKGSQGQQQQGGKGGGPIVEKREKKERSQVFTSK